MKLTLPRRPSKYRAIKTQVDGITFDSKREANRYKVLKTLERCGHIEHLERQVSFPLTVVGVNCGRYVADFGYYYAKTGFRVIEDVKGVRTAVYKLKKKLMLALYRIEIKEV